MEGIAILTYLRKKDLTMRDLKIIAHVTMLIDHIGAMIIQYFLNNYGSFDMPLSYGTLNIIYTIMRLIGRLAFPIFAFSIAEGIKHTRDIKKYILRLFIFALISEIPFDLALKGELGLEYQNVIWTFLIAVLGVYFIELNQDKIKKFIVFIISLVLAFLFRTDYSFIGVLMVYCFYFIEDTRERNISTGILMALQATAVLALVPLNKYNGQKGMKSGRILYWFYPFHLFIIYLILLFLDY